MKLLTILGRRSTTARALATAAMVMMTTLAIAQEEPASPVDESSMNIPGEANDIQQATMDYGAGMRAMKSAAKLRDKATRAEGADREKLMKKADASVEQAIQSFISAVRGNPQHQKAYLELGEALRSEGRYEEAIPAYSRALQFESEDWRALHGRAVSLVEINQIPDAVNAYPLLSSGDPKLAAELVASVKSWLEKRRADPQGLTPSALDEVAAWVAERETS